MSVLTPLPSNLRALLDGLARLSPRVAEHAGIAAELAQQRDVSAFLVGGVVRDFFDRRESVDLDMVVEGDGVDFARRLASRLGVEVLVHSAFLTAELPSVAGCRIDIATARRERYLQPAALPVIEPAPLAEDLARRDFSLNAMALSLRSPGPLVLIDPFSGHRDLEAGRLRVLHDRSFIDDPTRILRAARFATRLGMRLDAAGEELVAGAIAAGVFERLSGARLRQELRLTLCRADLASPSLAQLAEWRVAENLHPALVWGGAEKSRLSAVHEVMNSVVGGAGALNRAPTDRGVGGDGFALSLASWVFDRPQPARRDLAEHLQLPAASRSLIVEGPERIRTASRSLLYCGVRTISPQAASRILRHLGDDELLLMIACEAAPAAGWARREYEEMRRLELTITGADLLAIGFQPGRRLGKVLERVRDARLDRAITAGEELAMARAMLEEAEQPLLCGEQ